MPSTLLTTKKAVDALPHPKEGQTLYWDSDLHGFGIRVGVRDKVFILQRDIRGRSRRITIGRYGSNVGDLTLQQARRKAEKLAGEMVAGHDPVEQRELTTGGGITLRQAWVLYEAHLDAKERSPVTKAGYWGLLQYYVSDWLDQPLIEITPEAAHQRHVKLTKERGRYAANAVMRVIRAIWRRALRQHRGIGLEPTKNVDFNQEKPREGVVKDLPGWWRGVQLIDNPIRRDLYTWLLFTGCRSGESKTLRWSQIDFDAGIARFPKTKTGKFDLPLSSFLIDLLKARRSCAATRAVYGDSPWVFPGDAKAGHVVEVKLSAAERKLFAEEWTPHTLRHTWITASAFKVQIPELHSRLLVNHAIAKKRDAHAGYLHADLDDMRQSQQRMSAYMLAAVMPRGGGNVVKLKRTGLARK
jgi:integrase